MRELTIDELNTESFYFKDAMSKNLLEKTPLEIDGVLFYVASKDLGNLSAARYYYALSTQNFYADNGIDPKVDGEYCRDILESSITIKGDVGFLEDEKIREKLDRLVALTKVYAYHKTRVNYLYMMLDFVAVCLLAPCENPYDIDEKIQLEKIQIFNNALNSERKGEFLGFFQIFLEQKGKDFLRPLKQFTNSTLFQPLNKEEISNREYSLALDILEQREQLALLRDSEGSKKVAKLYRILYDLTSIKQEIPQFSSLLKIE